MMESNLLLEQYGKFKKAELEESPFRCLLDTNIEINPHQINAFCAAIQALKTGGIVLADEVGLGKTIEAGLTLKYVLDSGAKRVLIALPATLRKQWEIELEEKFGLESTILDRFTVESEPTGWKTWLEDKSKVRIVLASYDYSSKLMKRFPNVKWDFIIIDEAHNLAERGREMYSASICREDAVRVRKVMKERAPRLYRSLGKPIKQLKELQVDCGNYLVLPGTGSITMTILKVQGEFDAFLEAHKDVELEDEVRKFYFDIRNFLNIAELIDENYVVYAENGEDGLFRLKLFCVNPAVNLGEYLKKGRSAVFFSATLLPMNYYRKLLSNRQDDYGIYVESPFSQKNRCILNAGDVSSLYSRRGYEEYHKIAEYIAKTVWQRKGNYMVFFPSYKMLEEVYAVYEEEFSVNWVKCICQNSSMKEQEREEFLQEFEQNQESLVAFCIMGGIFSEGIDLLGEKLIGAILVGTGLPQLGNEREILRSFYTENGENGFDYAYRYPGMNKVLQAAGRVIRTREDHGVILLLDERFRQREYSNLFPVEWNDRENCSLNTVQEKLKQFWEKAEDVSGK